MNPQSDFASSFPAQLESILDAFARLIAARVPGIAWRVELPASRVYDLVAVLTFMDRSDLESELVAVSLETDNMRSGIWTIDVTDREALPLDLGGESLADTLDIDMRSPEAAARDIDSKLRQWSERIVRELRP